MLRAGSRFPFVRPAVLVPCLLGVLAVDAAAQHPTTRKVPRGGIAPRMYFRPARQLAPPSGAKVVVEPAPLDPGFVVTMSGGIDPGLVIERSADIDPRIVAAGRGEAQRR